MVASSKGMFPASPKAKYDIMSTKPAAGAVRGGGIPNPRNALSVKAPHKINVSHRYLTMPKGYKKGSK